jgi:hypothetical protein
LVLEDSGNANTIYGLSQRELEKVSQSRMLKNIDWEDITKDRREFIHRGFW